MDLVKIRVRPEGQPEYDVCGFVAEDENTYEHVVLRQSDIDPLSITIEWKRIDKAETCDVVGELKRPEGGGDEA